MRKRVSLITLIAVLAIFHVHGKAAERTHDIVPEDYFSQVFLNSVDVSPDGNFTAFVDYRWDKEQDGRFNDIWIVNNDTKQIQRLTFDPGNEYGVQWTPDSEQIYFIGHYEQPNAEEPPYDGSAQVWRIDRDGKNLTAITRVPDGIYDFQLAHDGSALYYTRTKEHLIDAWKDLRSQYKGELEFGHGVEEVSELYKLDLTSWRSEKLVDELLHIHEFDVSPDGNQVAMITTKDGKLVSLEGWSDVRVYNVKSGEAEVLDDNLWRADAPSPHGWLGGLAWSDDGEKLAWSVDFDGYPGEILVADYADGEPEIQRIPRPDGVHMAGNVLWSSDSKAVAFLGDNKARQRVYSVNVESGKSTNHTPGDVVIDGFDFAGDKGALVAIQSELTYYHDLVYWSGTNKSERLTRLNPQVDTWKLPQISTVKWEGAEGDTVEGILELPPDWDGEGNLPLLVNLHGGPTASEKYCFLFWIYGRTAFAAKGWAMLSPNYRGSMGYGDEFMIDLIGHENDRDVEDIMTGVDHLIAEGLVDPERMAVAGWSNGGFLTNALIASNRFKAASSGAGVVDMTVQLLEEDTPGHVINYMEGLPWEVPQEYQDASPLYGFKPGITTATLIHVGKNDPRVPATHSRGLHRMLYRYLDVPVELVIYPGAGHGLTKYTHRLAKMQWDHAWFDKYVLGN